LNGRKGASGGRGATGRAAGHPTTFAWPNDTMLPGDGLNGSDRSLVRSVLSSRPSETSQGGVELTGKVTYLQRLGEEKNHGALAPR